MHLMPTNDLAALKRRYIDVIWHTPDIARYARWVYGRHPTDDLLRSYIENGEMYVMGDGAHTAGMVAIVMHQGPDYRRVPWARDLADDQVATIHLLAVCPEYQGKGLGGRILESAEGLAVMAGKKALRLDVLRSNLPAQRMYERAGYTYRGRQRLYAENTGWTDFLYYEKDLDRTIRAEGMRDAL